MEASRKAVGRWAGIVACAILTCLSLTQCQFVSDRLTGVDVATLHRRASDCLNDCQRSAAEALRAEILLHIQNVRACAGNSSCLNDEAHRHFAALLAIQAEFRACARGCHHQGGGDGGR